MQRKLAHTHWRRASTQPAAKRRNRRQANGRHSSQGWEHGPRSRSWRITYMTLAGSGTCVRWWYLYQSGGRSLARSRNEVKCCCNCCMTWLLYIHGVVEFWEHFPSPLIQWHGVRVVIGAKAINCRWQSVQVVFACIIPEAINSFDILNTLLSGTSPLSKKQSIVLTFWMLGCVDLWLVRLFMYGICMPYCILYNSYIHE